MATLSFRNHIEVFKCAHNTPWWQARYDIEKVSGWWATETNSTVVGYLKDDLARRVALHDDYTIQRNDVITLVRTPLPKKHAMWIPPACVSENAWRDAIRAECDESARLRLIQSQMNSQHAAPHSHHPSRSVILTTCSGWRTNEGTVLPISHHNNLVGDNYVCHKCNNHLSPKHHVDDCPAPVTRKRDWLHAKPLPHSIPRSTMREVVIQRPADVLTVTWVDVAGRLWTRR